MAGNEVAGRGQLSAEIASLMKTNPDPEFVRANLSETSKRRFAALVQERRIAQTLRVLGFLNRRGVDFAVLKGVTLARFDRARDFADLDILVDRKDVEAVGGMLEKEFGYFYSRPQELESLARGDDGCHDVSLHHSHMLPIELHFRLFNYTPEGALHPLSGKVILEMDGVRVPALRKELQLLEVLLHNALHHMFICDREKWARDINILVDNYDIDWEGFADIARSINHSEVAYLTARLLRSFRKTKARIPGSAMRMLAPRSLACYLKKPVFAWALYFCRDRLLPPPDILEARFHVPRSSPLFAFCYLANWLRLPFTAVSLVLRRR
jgi:predicted MarR family transcription regulator